MRRKNAVYEYRKEKHDDLMRAYHEQLQMADTIILTDVVKKAVKSPAKRFWVSEERAQQVLSAMKKGLPTGLKDHNRLRMFKDILRIVENLKKEYPTFGFQRLVRKAIQMPAPEFYISPEYAIVILHKIKHERKNK